MSPTSSPTSLPTWNPNRSIPRPPIDGRKPALPLAEVGVLGSLLIGGMAVLCVVAARSPADVLRAPWFMQLYGLVLLAGFGPELAGSFRRLALSAVSIAFLMALAAAMAGVAMSDPLPAVGRAGQVIAGLVLAFAWKSAGGWGRAISAGYVLLPPTVLLIGRDFGRIPDALDRELASLATLLPTHFTLLPHTATLGVYFAVLAAGFSLLWAHRPSKMAA